MGTMTPEQTSVYVNPIQYIADHRCFLYMYFQFVHEMFLSLLCLTAKNLTDFGVLGEKCTYWTH